MAKEPPFLCLGYAKNNPDPRRWFRYRMIDYLSIIQLKMETIIIPRYLVASYDFNMLNNPVKHHVVIFMKSLSEFRRKLYGFLY